MTLEECYRRIGGDAVEVADRMSGKEFVQRYIVKFLDDDSFDMLSDAVQNGEREEAFRAAHTIKGICQTFGFGSLLASVERLTESLRTEAEELPPDTDELFAQVRADYDLTVGAIRAYAREKEELL